MSRIRDGTGRKIIKTKRFAALLFSIALLPLMPAAAFAQEEADTGEILHKA